ncbi:Peptidyl-prolyl cis-trans isomerase C [Edwardsiella tarda]|nr:Peptidyl-prolyl cis-trans isomerase C [Edwardsiella tarda]
MARSAAALHILVDSQTEAEALLQKLRRGANFQALARRHSRCPSKRQGGRSR